MMNPFGNITTKVYDRQIKDCGNISFERSSHVTPDLVRRIGLETELEGHRGCVNCLEWNEKGTLLASGSDDFHVILWDPLRYQKLVKMETSHRGNIFSVKFLPCTNDSMVVSGAADHRILVHNIATKDTTDAFSCHFGRVKRIATAPNIPFMFWSAAEDGTIMQFDLRAPETCGPNPKNVLVNLIAHLGMHAEAKCLAINPLRPEQLAVGANDPYVRLYDRRMLTPKTIKFPGDGSTRTSWERQSLLATFSDSEEFGIPDGAAQYYIAGHLPQKQQDYKRRYRTLASTYVTFGPDGNELLVNLGGEQIYLFDVNSSRKPHTFAIPRCSLDIPPGPSKEMHEPRNGTNGTTNGCTNGFARHSKVVEEERNRRRGKEKRKMKYEGKPLPPAVDAIRAKANEMFEKQQYTQAIILNNKAIAMEPNAPVLYGNRAAAFMKRAWDGDLYAALGDCCSAIRLDRNHVKAHFRLARCLFELSWTKDAAECLKYFKNEFPDYAKNSVCEGLEKDILNAIAAKAEEEANKEENEMLNRYTSPNNISNQEKKLRENAFDYKQRFCGHCNTTTDIKEANFFGQNGQYILAGSDDGSFFIWDKLTTNIVRVLRGDDSIVNCLQPHPTCCMLATSGIDPVVRLWSPRPEDGMKDEREIDNSEDAATANQKRMNADPLEVMLMNMGYRITGVLDGDEDEDRGDGPPGCRPS